MKAIKSERETKIFFRDHFLGSLETKLRIVTKPSHLVSNPF